MDWRLVFSTFGLLFLAELGDKTQLAVFALAARHQTPWSVFLGATLALTTVTLIGAFLGGLIGLLGLLSVILSALGYGLAPTVGNRIINLINVVSWGAGRKTQAPHARKENC